MATRRAAPDRSSSRPPTNDSELADPATTDSDLTALATMIPDAPNPPHYRLPPVPVLLSAVMLIVCAEVGGASMVRFKLELTRWARNAMLARPAVHGLVGVRDVDERVLDEALVKFDAGLRLFHLHAEGMGLVILATTTVAATLASSPAPRRAIIALLTVGGAGRPLRHPLRRGLLSHPAAASVRAAAARLA